MLLVLEVPATVKMIENMIKTLLEFVLGLSDLTGTLYIIMHHFS